MAQGSVLINIITLFSVGIKVLDIMANLPRVMKDYGVEEVSDLKNISGKWGT